MAIQGKSILHSCSGGVLCSTSAYKSYGGAQNSVLPVDGDITTIWRSNGQDPASGYIWWQMDFQTQQHFLQGVIRNDVLYIDRMDHFQIWIGDDAVFPGSNTQVYYSPNTNIVTETFAVKGVGRYLYVASTLSLLQFAEIDILGSTVCDNCEKNQYCPGGLANYTTACPYSQFSLAGSSSLSQCGCPVSATLLPSLNCTCNNGTYKVMNAAAPLVGWQCDACPATKYCQFGSAISCPAGYSCPSTSSYPVICPKGSYCLASSSVPIPCPTAKFTANTGTTSLSGCLSCAEGSYCPGTGLVLACPVGSYCPFASTAPIACPVESYASVPGLSSCLKCTVCQAGTFQTTQCSSTQDRVCTPCAAVNPLHSVFISTSPSCPWVCDSGYWGGSCAPCRANYWCRLGVQNRCPLNSVSQPLSSSQSACVCELGYMSTGRVTGTSPCALCPAGVLCNGVPVKEIVVSAIPLVNVSTQILMAQKPMPPADSMVSLFRNVPTNIALIRATLPNKNATIFLRSVCRGTYCVACDDSTSSCIRLVTIGLRSQSGYVANATLIQRDVMYAFVASTVADCAPQITGLSPEFVSDNLVVISSVAAVSSVRVVCVSDAAKFVDIAVAAA